MKYYTPHGAAKALGMAPPSLYRHVKEGKIKLIWETVKRPLIPSEEVERIKKIPKNAMGRRTW